MNSNTQLTTAPILVLEDEPINQTLIGSILDKMGVSYLIKENGRAGLKAMENREFSVFIVDLVMPEMNGEDFIRELRKINNDAVVLVQTTVNIPETIVEIMKLHVYDYLFKPFDLVRFQKSVRSALEYYKYLKAEKERSSQISLRLRSQLDWLSYKEKRRQTETNAQEKNLIYNLKTSMSQGAGIGALISMLELLQSNMKKEDENCYVSCEVMDLIFKNLDISKRMIDGITSISDILESEIKLKPGHASDIQEAIKNKSNNLADIFYNKNIEFSISDLPHDSILNINIESMENIIEEILVNAAKYSPRSGELSCFFHYTDGYFVVSIKNDIDTTSGGHGVPPEYEKLVTEPFIRFSNPDESVIHKEKFSIGLGLSVVDHVLRSHGGQFFIRNVVDHMRNKPVTCVLAELLLPLSS